MNSEDGRFQYMEVTNNVISMVPSKPISKIKDPAGTVITTCIALPKELIFIDCGCYPEIVRKFRKHMEKHFNKKTSHLILTHSHWDHIIAMEEFKDVNIVCSKAGIQGIKNTIDMIEDKGPQECERIFDVSKELGEIISNVKISIPNITVEDEFLIKSDGKEVLFKVIGGHSLDSSYIYVSSEKIICTGDNLLECYAQLPGNPDDSLNILKHWESLAIDKVIPGHGKIVSKEYITNLRIYYEDLIFALKKIITQNLTNENHKLTIKEIITDPSIPNYFISENENWMPAAWRGSNWIHDTIRVWYRFIKRKLKSEKVS